MKFNKLLKQWAGEEINQSSFSANAWFNTHKGSFRLGESVVKITKRQLRKLIFEEAENLGYDLSKSVVDDVLATEEDEDIEALESAWAGGDNLHLSIDHAKAQGSEATTRGIEVATVSETKRRIRRIINKTVLKEAPNFRHPKTGENLFLMLHDIIGIMLDQGIDPIELARELEGLASEVEETSSMAFSR